MKHFKANDKSRPVLVYFGLEDWKREELEAIAAERGKSFEELVNEGVRLFLTKNRGVRLKRGGIGRKADSPNFCQFDVSRLRKFFVINGA